MLVVVDYGLGAERGVSLASSNAPAGLVVKTWRLGSRVPKILILAHAVRVHFVSQCSRLCSSPGQKEAVRISGAVNSVFVGSKAVLP